jgi:hypothetical protein
MFKIEVPDGGKGYIFEICSFESAKRPTLEICPGPSSAVLGMLSNDMHEWLEEYDIKYSDLISSRPACYVVIDKLEDTILFKLVWG